MGALCLSLVISFKEFHKNMNTYIWENLSGYTVKGKSFCANKDLQFPRPLQEPATLTIVLLFLNITDAYICDISYMFMLCTLVLFFFPFVIYVENMSYQYLQDVTEVCFIVYRCAKMYWNSSFLIDIRLFLDFSNTGNIAINTLLYISLCGWPL